jgi:hypothetical protein
MTGRISTPVVIKHRTAKRCSSTADLHQQEDATMKARRVLLAGGLLVAAITLGIPGAALADPEDKCKESMLRGLYVFTASGWTTVNPGPAVPLAIVELIRFNGDGTASAPGGRVSFGGFIAETVSDATYTPPTPVDKGCESVLTFSAPPQPSLYLFIPHDAKTLQAILINNSSVFQGPVTKVSN